MKYYSVIKKYSQSCRLQQYGWSIGYYAKWNKSYRERQIPYDFCYICNLKQNKWTDITKKQSHRHKEQAGGYQSRGDGRGEK